MAIGFDMSRFTLIVQPAAPAATAVVVVAEFALLLEEDVEENRD
jgi:hypothetical protein